MPKQKIKMGSNTVLITAPRAMLNMAYLGPPSARMMEFSAAGIIMKGRPAPMTQPYYSA